MVAEDYRRTRDSLYPEQSVQRAFEALVHAQIEMNKRLLRMEILAAFQGLLLIIISLGVLLGD